MSALTTGSVVAEIRAEMGRQHINGSELAKRLNKSEMWVSRRLRGVTSLTVSDLATIAGALGVPVSRLLPEPERAA